MMFIMIQLKIIILLYKYIFININGNNAILYNFINIYVKINKY
jgi:hypothetical protein